MTNNAYVIYVIHGRSAYPAIIPSEPQRLDEIDRRPQTGAETHNGADVSGNFRFKQSNTH